MKLIKLLQFISYYQGEVVGHRRKKEGKGGGEQEKNIRNQEKNKKK